MNRLILAEALMLAATFVAPCSHAVTSPCAGNSTISCHVIGAGSTAQFLTAALNADQLAYDEVTAGNTNGSCTYHWTAQNAAQIIDNRSGSEIPIQAGNIWMVWVASPDPGAASCATSTVGATNIAHLWLDVSADSTTGVRSFSAQQTAPDTGPGGLVKVLSPTPAAGNLIGPASFWADESLDIKSLPAAIVTAVNNGPGQQSHINLALSDIRPEDALFADARAITGKSNCTGTGTCSKLGYSTSNPDIGSLIRSTVFSTSGVTPVAFALSGGTDPFTGVTVPAYTTIPIGAAPLIFVYDHGTLSAGQYPLDLTSGVTPGTHQNGQLYPLANLFDGSTACTTHNPAFTNNTGFTTANVTVVLDTPLGGEMNTAEFNLFRSLGNTEDSQERNITPENGGDNNPLNLACIGGGGKRARAVGTAEISKAVNLTADTLGYIFFGFDNFTKVVGANNVANYNYLTLDGVDPIFGPLDSPTPNQQLPICTGPCPSAGAGSIWTGPSFAHLRDGTYKAWSLYRWLSYTSNTDPLGPVALARFAQDNVDSSIADYVPFNAPPDGLDVYRSHFKQCEIMQVSCDTNNFDTPNNGPQIGYVTLGGTAEQGGDVGGLVQGPFPTKDTGTASLTNGSPTVTRHSGPTFTTGSAWAGLPIILNANPDCTGGTVYTIASVQSTNSLTMTAPYSGATKGDLETCVPMAPGVLNKRQ